MTRRHEQLQRSDSPNLARVIAQGHRGPACPRNRVVGHVKLAPDMADATAFVSAYPAENLDLVLHGLKSATPHLRRELARTRQSATHPKTLV